MLRGDRRDIWKYPEYPLVQKYLVLFKIFDVTQDI